MGEIYLSANQNNIKGVNGSLSANHYICHSSANHKVLTITCMNKINDL